MCSYKDKYSPEEIQRMKKFITEDLKPAYLLFKDKEDNPDKYVLKEGARPLESKYSCSMVKSLAKFREGFVKVKEEQESQK